MAAAGADKGLLPGLSVEWEVRAFWGLLPGQRHSYSTWDFPQGSAIAMVLDIAILSLFRSRRCSCLQYSSVTLCM